MTKPMEDKLFFVDKLPPRQDYLFVDFGCADGALIQHLVRIYDANKYVYIGYDCSEVMIDFAKTSFCADSPNEQVEFTTDWDMVSQYLERFKDMRYKTVLILSSVIHEIYSYESEQGVKDFWDKVKEFDIVVVRDMMCSDTIERESDLDDTMRVRKSTLGTISKYLTQFEERWGSIDENKNFVHFLLKYRYTINWDRECNENYFPIKISEFLQKMKSNFRLDYFEKFRVRFIENKVYEDFGIILRDTTHIKGIFIKC